MTKYTPTTEGIRTAWTHGYHGDNYPDAKATDAEFDRWLAAHDAEVRARAEAVVAMSAYDDGYTAGEAAARAEDGIRLREFHGDGVWRDDTGTIWVRQAELVDAVRAGVVAEEPEWEYGSAIREQDGDTWDHEYFTETPITADQLREWNEEHAIGNDTGSVVIAVRRSIPRVEEWVPVEQEGIVE